MPSAAPTPAEIVPPVAGPSVNVTLAIAVPTALAGVTGVSVSGGLLASSASASTGTCAPSGCSITVAVKAGPSAFTVSLLGANSAVLNTGTFARYILAVPQTIGLSFGGTVASLRPSVDSTELTAGTAGTSQLTLMAFDASGNRIIGQTPLAAPVTVSASDNQSTVAMSATSFSTPDQRITLTYAGGTSTAVTYTAAMGSLTGTKTAILSIAPTEVDKVIGGVTEAIGGALAPSNEMTLAFETGKSFLGRDRRVNLAALPAQFSLVAKMPTPGSQGASDSCSGWAAGYAEMSTIIAARTSLPQFSNPVDTNQVFSPAFIYNQINGGKSGYASMNDALTVLMQLGGATWAQMPWTQTDFLTQPSAATLAAAQKTKISDWATIESSLANVTAVKTAIAAGVPVIVRTSVDDGLSFLTAGQIWNNVTAPNPSGHFMNLVGWDDSQNAFLLYNSWGTGWANNGVGLLSYAGWATGPGTFTWTVAP